MYAVLLSKMQSFRLWLIAVISVLPYTAGFSQSVYTICNPFSMYSYTGYNTNPFPYKSSLRGKVVDKNQNPVANIKVTVAELDIHTYTDSEGNYAFCNFSEGKYTIIFEDGKTKKELSPLIMPKKLVYNIEW